jgi:hypothetical protein
MILVASNFYYSLKYISRGVAQPGSAHGSGPWSRRFKSFRPDQKLFLEQEKCK